MMDKKIIKSKKALLESDSSSESDDDSSSSSSSSINNDDNNKNKVGPEINVNDDKNPTTQRNVSFSINVQYAKEYQSRKLREELQQERLKSKNDDGVGVDNDDDAISDSSDDEEEDENAHLLTTRVDADILRTINALRNKDESIYNPNVRFFPATATTAEQDEEDSDDDEASDKPKKSKPKRVKDVLREQILEQMKNDEEEEEASDSSNHNNNKNNKLGDSKVDRLAYDQQQQELRKAFLVDQAEGDNASDNEEDEDDNHFLVLKKRQVHDKEDPQIQQQYAQELQTLEKSLLNKKDKDVLVDPRGEVEDGEKFLLDFIKNKTWIDKNDLDNHNDNDDDNSNSNGDHDNDDDSLEHLEQADEFETRYNFRFEDAVAQAAAAGESGAYLSVQGYARSQTMNTLRRKDETRREKRLARKERKAAERAAKEEKLRRLKNAKRQEIEQKLKQVKAVLGSAVVDTNTADNDDDDNSSKTGNHNNHDHDKAPIDEAAILKLLEGDFDPEKFEKTMQEAFGDDFYQKEDAEWKTDDDVQKALKEDAEIDYDVLENEQEEPDAVQEDDQAHEENIDDDEPYVADDDADDEEKESELEKKLRAKMMDKLYELDYEDIVAGMPTRFKYREVEPNNYGLTTEEILLARDQTLQQYVSLKKMAPYREGEEYRVTSRKRRKFREQLQQDVEEAEKRLKKQGITVNDNHGEAQTDDGPEKKKKKRRRLNKSSDKNLESNRKNEPLKDDKTDKVTTVSETADGMADSSKTKRRRKKKGRKLAVVAADPSMATSHHAAKLTAISVQPSEKTKAKPQDAESKKAVATGTVEAKKSRKKKSKKDKKVSVEGVSAARLASYGL